LFQVDRRSLHFWASGKPLNRANEERLGQILAVVRRIDSGSSADNRALLLGASEGGVIPFEMLVEGRFNEVLRVLGSAPRVTRPSPKPLSRQARMARAPRRPQDLVGANQEVGHKEIGKARRPRVARVKKRDE
jgi:alpha-beta hydrolase superfamily lysophospholipase